MTNEKIIANIERYISTVSKEQQQQIYKSGKIYRITKRIKLHTKPLYEADITLTGRYVRESQNFYIFDTFKVKKANVIKIVETA